MMDMKCMSHRTTNRMKPKTASPCMARSSRAMAVSGDAGAGDRLGVTEARKRNDQVSGRGVGLIGGAECEGRAPGSVSRINQPPADSGGRQERIGVRGSGDSDTETGLGLVVLVSGSQSELQGFDSHQTGHRSADKPGGGGRHGTLGSNSQNGEEESYDTPVTSAGMRK